LNEGPEGFRKNVPPSAFDWSQICPLGEKVTGKPITVRPTAYFDIEIAAAHQGRIEIELASDVVPKTVDNFIRLVTNGSSKLIENLALDTNIASSSGYKGTKFHQIQKQVVLVGGDVEDSQGEMSHSAYKERFIAEENFIIPHSEKGLVSMVSVGVGTTGSQFAISLNPIGNPHFNGRWVVFGRVVKGMDVLDKIQKVFTFRGAPSSDIVISDCGVSGL
jgi:cyclophilin family peptidyl-prolyl cis-trans isomerase